MSDDKPDSILDDVRAAAAELANDAPSSADTPSAANQSSVSPPDGTRVQDDKPADTRARDDQGRFAKVEDKPEKRETLTLKEKAPEVGKDTPAALDAAAAKPPEAAAPQQAQPQPATGQDLVAPPLHWKGNAKVQWNKLPNDVRLGILEDHQALQEARAAVEPLSRAIEPHRELWLRDAGSVENAIAQLGQFYRAYLDNPVGLIQHIARTRGIDLGQPQGQQGQQPGTPPPAADINSLIAQTVQQAIAPFKEQMQQTEVQQHQQVIEAFARDPAHPYFQDVKVHMGHLLRAGQAKDMQDAYDQAVWANPAIRQQLMEAQLEERRKQAAADADKARKAAAASVRGSPIPGATNGAGNPNASVYDDVRAAFAEHGAA